MDLKDVDLSSVKKSDLGLVGLILLGAQIFSAVQSTTSLSDEMYKIKVEFQSYQTEREMLRKDDLRMVMSKLDQINSRVTRIDKKVRDFPLEDDQYSFNSSGRDLLSLLKGNP